MIDTIVEATSATDFIDRYFKPERMNPVTEPDKRESLIEACEEEIQRFGYASISKFSSVTGKYLRYIPADKDTTEQTADMFTRHHW